MSETDPQVPASSGGGGPTELGGLDPGELLARGLHSVKPSGGVGAWEPPSPEEVGRLLPPYRIEKLIGRGGMGAVYQGIQLNLDRPVAIKLLPVELSSDRDFVARFEREARTLARLQHSRIVTIHDFGRTAEGHLYFVMEYIDGTNLREILRGPGLRADQALAVVGQLCDALQVAHREGIVHRDIKPENVLITRDGYVKLADFGLARPPREDDASALTATNMVMGTAEYMAPEQRYSASKADHRSDLFALGVMLYEMLTGQTPRGVFDPPSRKVRVDVRIDEVVLKALQSEPERRYQKASELKTDVDRIRSTPPPAVAPPPAASSRKVRKKSSTPLIVAAVLAVVLLTGFGAMLFWIYGRQKAYVAEVNKLAEISTPEVTPDPTPRATPEIVAKPSVRPATPTAAPVTPRLLAPSTPAPMSTPPDTAPFEAALLSSKWTLESAQKDNARWSIELAFRKDGTVTTNTGQTWKWRISGPRHLNLQVIGQTAALNSSFDLVFDPAFNTYEGDRFDQRQHVQGTRVKAVAATPVPDAPAETGFTPLLTPGNLADWKQCGVGGVKFTGDIGTTWMPNGTKDSYGCIWYARQKFADFVLRLEYRNLVATSNSGVIVRAPALDNDLARFLLAYEVQIYGGGGSDQPTGAIYGSQRPLIVPQRPVGQWNELEITAVGQKYTVRLNGLLVNEYLGSRAVSGFIGLQNHRAGAVEFRHVRIKELSTGQGVR